MDQLELPKGIHDSITTLCASGDKLANDGAYEEAVADYNKAWEMVPEPKNDWSASTWILGGVDKFEPVSG